MWYETPFFYVERFCVSLLVQPEMKFNFAAFENLTKTLDMEISTVNTYISRTDYFCTSFARIQNRNSMKRYRRTTMFY